MAPAPAEGDYLPGINSRTLIHDGAIRDYDVYAPGSYPSGQAVPLVIDLHGFGSDKAGQRDISGWNTKSDTEGFLLVHPNGLFNSWNAGVCCGGAMTCLLYTSDAADE